MRGFLALLAAFAMGAEATAQELPEAGAGEAASGWRYEAGRACIASSNILEAGPPAPAQTLELCVSAPQRVVLRFAGGGQLNCLNVGLFVAVQSGCLLKTRIDGGGVRFIGATEGDRVGDNQIVVNGGAGLMRRLQRAQAFEVEVLDQWARFTVAGLQWPPPEPMAEN